MIAMTKALALVALLGAAATKPPATASKGAARAKKAAPAPKAGAPARSDGVEIRQAETEPEPPPQRLATAEDVAKLCRALEPAERFRAKGDAVEQGEAGAKHEAERDAALGARYEVSVPAAGIAFAPYDGGEGRLALLDPVQVPIAGGTARLWPTEQRSLPVVTDAAAARRVLDAQRAGSLGLALVFDLPDDATCGTGARGKSFTVPVEPVSWVWTAGGAAIAAGGSAAERPTVTASGGARPAVSVGEPLTGPPEASKSVLAKRAALEECYAEALRRDPAADGMLVANLGGGKTTIAADSVGDVAFASCVQKALAPLALQGLAAAVPIRFELAQPAAAPPGGKR